MKQYTISIDASASTCLYVQDIPGTLNSTNSVYKATNQINASCIICDNSNIQFKSGQTVTLASGFEVQLGSSLLVDTGVYLDCP